MTKLDKGRGELTEFVKAQFERLSLERKEFESFDQHVQALQNTLGALERGFDGLAGKEKAVVAMGQKAEELAGRQEGLTDLETRLGQVADLGTRVTRQHETLTEGRKELDMLRKELDEFYKTQAEISKVRDEVGDDLDNQMTRIAAHQQLVEKIDTRLNTLNALSVSVDKRLEEQIARCNEVEGLKNDCDGLGVQVGGAHQKLQAVSSLQHKLLPISTQVASLRSQVEKAATAFKGSQRDEAELAAQEKRLTVLADGSRDVAASVEERLKQIQGVSEELTRASTIKEELTQELGRVQARQRDVGTHVKTAEDQIAQVTKQLKQLDQRHTQLSFAEKRIAGFEGRLTELKTLSDNVESQIQAIATREAFVGSVKKGVDEVHQISQRSRADLQHVVDHRNQVDALRAQLDAALKSVGETEERMAVIETRKKLVDEVQLKSNVIVHVLEDVRVNLEMLSEQRAVVDHVVESMARVNDTVHSAQATLKALQTERELAERIERGIKLLRSKTGVPVDQGR